MSHIWHCTYLAILLFAVRGLCWTVRLSYSPTKVGDDPMADFINVTMTTEENQSFSLSLHKVVHMSSHIPVQTLVQTPDGKYVTRNEMLGVSESTAFYQDLNNDAVIHVKRTKEASGALPPVLQFKGQFRYNGSLYFINRESRPKRDVTSSESPDESVYILQKQAEIVHALDAGIINSKDTISDGDNSQENPTLKSILRPQPHLLHRRVRRETIPTYYIDIVAFVDFRAYSRFLTSGKTREEALRSVLEYYTYIMTGADLLYQGITTTSYRLRVNLIKVVVAENSTASQFTEQYRTLDTPYYTVDSNSSLTAFRRFVSGPGSDMVGPYDHVMLFTGNDLTTSSNGQLQKDIAGQAFTGTLCDKDGGSSSIIEDLGGYMCVSTAAHELGHSISAKHDGEGNPCSSADRYIMATGSGKEDDPSTRLHPWKFSNCSLEYFTDFIGKLAATRPGAECLAQKLTADPAIPDVGESLPGLNYTANEQCRMFVDNNASSLCPSLPGYNLFANPSLICTTMRCNVPATQNCNLFSALRGTVCGDGKLCISGECVAHTSAPQKDETCVFGDDPLFRINDLSCAVAVKEMPFICYNYSTSCCESCKTVYKWPGCEYGDTAKNCIKETSFCALHSQPCCGTCGYGSSTTTTTTKSPSTTTTPTTTTTKPTIPTTTTQPTVPTTTTKPTTTNIPTTTKPTTTTASTTTTSKTTTKPTATTASTTTTPTTTTKPTTTTASTTTTPTTTPTTSTTPTTTTSPTTAITPTTPSAPATTIITSQSSAPMTTLQKIFIGVPVGVGSLVIILIAAYLIYYVKFNKAGNFFKFRNSFDSNRSAPVQQKANNFRFVSRTTSNEGILQWKDLTSSNKPKPKSNIYLNIGV